MVPPDIMSTGEVSLLTPDMGMRKSTEDQVKQALGMVAYLVVLALLVFEPQIFGPHKLTKEQEEIGRRQMTVLLPPGALDALKPSAPPAPHEAVRVDPKVLKKVAPPRIEPPPPPAPAPRASQRENCPARQRRNRTLPQTPPAMSVPNPKTEVAQPKLEVPSSADTNELD